MVYEYYDQRSVSSILHEERANSPRLESQNENRNRSRKRTCLNPRRERGKIRPWEHKILQHLLNSQQDGCVSFGVVLLELLTGKSPIHTTGGDEIIHLVWWVHLVVREEWTAELFDLELMRCPDIEEEMVGMLQIALSCVVRMADQRPKMADVVKMIEGVRRVDGGNRAPENRSESSAPPLPPPPPLAVEEEL